VRRSLGSMVGVMMLGVLLPGSAAAQAAAQAEPGRLVGRVVDAAQGAPIAGAEVAVVGGSASAVTALDGRYTINALPAGIVAIRVRMIGYTSKVVSGIAIPAGAAAAQDVSLEASVVQLEEITVTSEAERGSVSRAIDEQRNAVAIVNSVSAEQISNSPDGDAGQAVQRVSGVTVQDGRSVFVRGLGERYTTTSLNGSRIPSPDPEKKVVPLDLFPSGLLEGITTAKTFTPDRWGDFSGAQVDLRTREFPARRVVTFSTSVGINTAVAGKDVLRAPTTGSEWLGLAGSERDLPAPLEGVTSLEGRSAGEINSMIASFRNAWAPQLGSGGANGSMSLSVGGEDSFLGLPQLGYIGSFSYGYGNEVRADEARALATVNGGESLAPFNEYRGSTGRTSVLWGGLLNLSTRLGSHSKLSFNNTYNRSADNEANRLAGVNEEFATPLVLSRTTFTARTVRSNQLTGEHLLGDRQVLDWSLTNSNVSRTEPDRSDLRYVATVDPATGEYTPSAWFTGSFAATKTFSDLSENGWDGALNYRLVLGGTNNPIIVKSGVGLRTVDREASSQPYDIRNRTLTEPERSVAPELLFDGTYANDGRLSLFVNQVGGTYEAEDRISAGYVMADVPLARSIHLIGGARVERWALDLTSFDRTLSRDSTVLRRETDLLPSLALNVGLSPTHTLRLSASQTLSRPEYREITDVQSFNPIDGTFLFGNPDLQRALIQNYDARVEWYPRAGELLSFGVFAKRFNDPIERVFVFTTGSAALSYINAEKAVNYGVEVEARKSLDVISPQLAPFSVFANATLMRSRITPGDASLTNAERPMAGQAGYVLNGGLTYSQGEWSGTVLYNRVGRRISEAGFQPYPDVYEEPRDILDVSLQVPVYHDLSFKLDGRNLLDAPIQFTQGGVDRLSYRTGRVFSVGARWTP
jgi:hypothetical protein